MNNKLKQALIYVALGLLLAFIVHKVVNMPTHIPDRIEIRTDTIYIPHHDTIRIEQMVTRVERVATYDTVRRPNLSPATDLYVHTPLITEEVVADRIFIGDSEIFIPIEHLATDFTKDSTLRGTIFHSGYKSTIDSVAIHWLAPSVTTTKTITKYNRFYVGPTIGVGYGLIHKKFDVTLGLSAGYYFNIDRR